jgi:hypothetical protein
MISWGVYHEEGNSPPTDIFALSEVSDFGQRGVWKNLNANQKNDFG